ncbi:unnamed protein product [Cylicocyclus nassatus]|uniref:Secreted protein n=1 Tax=Cylicocyclus nassatus TaxID=53992 RepID=A0AA36GNQ6_CYLNA|nr:unnamed protein product [Cylicocyclus nassatus]
MLKYIVLFIGIQVLVYNAVVAEEAEGGSSGQVVSGTDTNFDDSADGGSRSVKGDTDGDSSDSSRGQEGGDSDLKSDDIPEASDAELDDSFYEQISPIVGERETGINVNRDYDTEQRKAHFEREQKEWLRLKPKWEEKRARKAALRGSEGK